MRWSSLWYLDLSENKVTEINIMKLPNIIDLNLWGNEIKKIESMEGLENI